MVARHDRRGLEVLFDESGVGNQELCYQGERGFVEQNGIAKQVEGRYYVDRPYGSFHRDSPVYTKVGRILPVPGRNLYQELLGESLVSGEGVGLTESDQVMHPIQFPHYPDIRSASNPYGNASIVGHRPYHLAGGILMPINFGAELKAPFEEYYLVFDDAGATAHGVMRGQGVNPGNLADGRL